MSHRHQQNAEIAEATEKATKCNKMKTSVEDEDNLVYRLGTVTALALAMIAVKSFTEAVDNLADDSTVVLCSPVL